MNRRNLIKTAFGATIAASLGLVDRVLGNTIELDNGFQLPTDFEKFFELINGFPMNEKQKMGYGVFQNDHYWNYFKSGRQQGLSTLQNTIALHESLVCKKNVMHLSPNLCMARLTNMNILDKIEKLPIDHTDLFIDRNVVGLIRFPNGSQITLHSLFYENGLGGHAPDFILGDNIHNTPNFNTHYHVQPMLLHGSKLFEVRTYAI